MSQAIRTSGCYLLRALSCELVAIADVPVDGSRVRGGTTSGYRGAAIRVLIGRSSTEDDLLRDWVMVHEMVHLALPDIRERYNRLSEGLAVYVEPIAGKDGRLKSG